MKNYMKTIYISGPITNAATGQPRAGWQKDFLDAEAKLRRMGFNVINPVDIAREVDDSAMQSVKTHDRQLPPSRADYILACLHRMRLNRLYDRLSAVYVIGDLMDCYRSHGVQMEASLAEVLGVPIYSEYLADCRCDHNLVALPGGGTLEELTGD